MLKDYKLMKEVAEARVARLFEMAESRAKAGDPESGRLSRNYIKLARKISSHYRVKMPKSMRERVCKNCNNPLIPGMTCAVRIASSGFRIYKCECGEEKRIPT